MEETYSDIDVPFTERNRLNVIFTRIRLREKICRFHTKKIHTKTSSDQVTNIEPKNETETQPSSEPKETQQPTNIEPKNETETQPSSEPKETQQPPNLKRKISHQESVKPSKYLRLQNIIDPVYNEQFLKDIEKQENKNHAFIEFSERYTANHGAMMNG